MLKTWLVATVLSIISFIVYKELVKVPQDFVRNCDMSGLAYGIIIFWILGIALVSFTSLIILFKNFSGKIKIGLGWFLFPVLFSIYFFVSVFEGIIDKEGLLLFIIVNLPWFLIWGFYYLRFKKLYLTPEMIK
ncbi:hypothetical protein QFZ37_001892 [Chryseobacterium ginsenosidimutans]|uniref:hypothetical protein n=1 Tax=Chryseobacterium ginsenosidimutans TaxID=687846 RepID=UPI002788DA43|nr:hypothetical protein [Chryseobacterium ginsenosidimutans]MDQ0593523.1 hypothetical protein [Chryseobacterium ginsenosidimutans]